MLLLAALLGEREHLGVVGEHFLGALGRSAFVKPVVLVATSVLLGGLGVVLRVLLLLRRRWVRYIGQTRKTKPDGSHRPSEHSPEAHSLSVAHAAVAGFRGAQVPAQKAPSTHSRASPHGSPVDLRATQVFAARSQYALSTHSYELRPVQGPPTEARAVQTSVGAQKAPARASQTNASVAVEPGVELT